MRESANMAFTKCVLKERGKRNGQLCALPLQFDLGSTAASSAAAYCEGGGNVQVQSSLAWLWVGQSIVCG